MARFILSPGDDVTAGAPGQTDEVIGTTTGGEVITVNKGTVVLDSSFNTGGDTIALAGSAGDYTATIVGSRVVLTSAAGVSVSIPLGTAANTLTFSGGDARSIAIVGSNVVIGTQTITSGDKLSGTPGGNGVTVTLTANPDTLTAETFNAPRVFTPGGTDQINSLNDDDVLTGSGTKAVLNFSFVNDADTGDNNIQPKLINIATVNIDSRLDGSATLDLQDSTGIKNINVTGIDDFATLTVDNIQDAGGTAGINLSVNNSNADDSSVEFLFDGVAVEGAKDVANLTLNDVNVTSIIINDENGEPQLGIESINLASTGSTNKVGVLDLEDAEVLTITGNKNLTLGDVEQVFRPGSNQVEAFLHTAGLANVAGSLTKIDASALTGNLVLNVGDEATANLDETSGTPVDLSVVAGSGNDTIRLIGGLDSSKDVIDGGAGKNTLGVFASVTSGTVKNIQTLDIRGDDETITVDAALFTGLESIWIRNESAVDTGVRFESDSATLTTTLNKLTAAQATKISIQHSVTGSTGITENVVNTNLADATGASDVVGVTIVDKLDTENRGVNTDPRFNFSLNAKSVESITIADNDSESNSVRLGEIASHKGTLTVTGGKAGQFLNFDTRGTTSLYNLDNSGGATDGADRYDGGTAGSGADRLVFTKIDAGTFVGDFIARVGDTIIDITTGSGNDTIIFDGSDLHAGLSITDKVNLGAGNDTVAIDGYFGTTISVGASEWTNFKGVDNIRLVDNDAAGYTITLTNELVDQTDGGSVINIINDLDPNSNGSAPDTESDVVIDARTLSATNFFTYDGAEVGTGASISDDRFILADPNINGGSKIDGGFNTYVDQPLGVANGNDDVLEVRNAAVVTVGDLANISNVGTLQFTNDTAAVQTSVLDLNTATIDRLVNTNHAASTTEQETILVQAIGNQVLAGATTVVNIDLTGVDFTTTGVRLETQSGGFFNIIAGSGPVTFAGGGGDDVFTGTAANDTISGGGGDDTLVGGAGDDVISGGPGSDRLVGGLGADTITSGTGFNEIVYNSAAEGGDTITDWGSFNDDIEISQAGFGIALGLDYEEGVVGGAGMNGNVLVLTDAGGFATVGAAAAAIAANANITTNAGIFLFFNQSSGNVEMWSTTDLANNGAETLLATFDNLTNPATIGANFSAADFNFA